MKKLSRSVTLSIAVCMVFVLLAACGSNNETPSSAEKPGEGAGNAESAKLRIVWWGSQARHDATKMVLDLYTKNNPGITFEPDFSGFDSYWDKLATQSAAKNAPDMIQMDAQYFNEYAARNQLADLSSGINVNDLDPNLLSAGKYQDKLFAIPIGSNPFGIVYNKAAIEKMGFGAPGDNWTWDELFQLARDIQPKLEKGKYALRDFTVDGEVYEMFQLSKGKGALSTPDGKLNVDEATWLEWCKVFAELRAEGVVPPAEISVSEKKYDPQLDLLLNGKVLIKQSYASDYPSWESVQPGVFGLAKAPRSTQAGGYIKPAMYWAISANSDHIEQSKKFIDFFINDKEAADILGVTRGVPVSTQILDYLQPKLNDAAKAQLGLINATKADANPFTVGPKGFGIFIVDFNKVGAEVIFDRITPEQAYQDIVKHWEADIK
ncbi:extracellular solute-binding protein [Paenibacillus oenotherae]|uniref:Extracellular solute-binding protein n=1 Tax=Paenibacillus oenotherae TaxID=1435645 RepID=A0ABS7D260_9BACL|nr:extracellular solute-binding protein [Paenibacillus oenotherae]MBW7474007.1 extracellular solute-binding protein [Paenibacillus oenotherae]